MRALKDGQIRDVADDEADVVLEHPSRLVGTHVNQISLQNAVAAPRLFYGARFYNQAESLTNPEAPLVRTLSDDGSTFERIMGERLGAIRSKRRGVVRDAKDGRIILDDPETGESEELDLYDNFLFNRKSGISQKPVVKAGDTVEPGALLAVSNYTDGEGNAALGLNARVGFVAYNGHSMDDALVVSESFAKRMVGKRLYAEELEKDKDTRTGKGHFTSLFPTDYTKDQLDRLDDEGFAKPGSILKQGDPYALATRPMRFSSNSGALGKLSRTMRTMRQNASKVWDREDPGVVVGTHKTKNGVKVVLSVESPLKPGDKVVERHGAKGIVSLIIPDDRMPRTEDGQPLEVLANFLGLPSRVNDATLLDALLGKVAKVTGKPYELPAFNGPNESWLDFVEGELAKHGLKGEEWVFDPAENRRLDRPVPVGYANFMKLHHAAEDKANMRGQGSYDENEQPVQGGSAAAQSKRLSTLELAALMSHSAYETMKEGATLRGAKNDNYWRALRQGQVPPEPGTPMVWPKFLALLGGSGYMARDLGKGKLRLGAFTDKDLDALKPSELKNGRLVDPDTLEPEPGGLFDPVLVGNDKWAKIPLPRPMPNPSFEKQIALLLGIREKDVERLATGEITLEEARQ